MEDVSDRPSLVPVVVVFALFVAASLAAGITLGVPGLVARAGAAQARRPAPRTSAPAIGVSPSLRSPSCRRPAEVRAPVLDALASPHRQARDGKLRAKRCEAVHTVARAADRDGTDDERSQPAREAVGADHLVRVTALVVEAAHPRAL